MPSKTTYDNGIRGRWNGRNRKSQAIYDENPIQWLLQSKWLPTSLQLEASQSWQLLAVLCVQQTHFHRQNQRPIAFNCSNDSRRLPNDSFMTFNCQRAILTPELLLSTSSAFRRRANVWCQQLKSLGFRSFLISIAVKLTISRQTNACIPHSAFCVASLSLLSMVFDFMTLCFQRTTCFDVSGF